MRFRSQTLSKSNCACRINSLFWAEMMTALASGVLLGLSAGLAPGPMLALVLAQTLRHGPREGCKIALTPLLTDAPIILLTLALATKLAELHLWLGIVSMAGAIFVFYLSWESFWPVRQQLEAPAERPKSWLKGIATNLLNPHPWLFWLTVGAAILAKTMAQGWLVAAAFLFGFYLLLVGSKVLVAVLAGRCRDLLAGRPYRVAMRMLAAMLACFALLLFREGLKHLAVI
jgi:threonine/homoserine/homoserine lactone efflux protein